MRKAVKFFSHGVTALLLLSLLAFSAKASDVQISPTGPTFSIDNLKFGCSGGGCINNNFFFAPLNSTGSIYVYIYNKNPTSAHSISAQITFSGNPSEQVPSDGTWSSQNPVVVLAIGVSPTIPGLLSGTSSGAAVVSINLSGSSTQSGSPDTARLVIVQSPAVSGFVPSDPCQSPNVLKQSANFSGAVTGSQNLIAPVAGKSIYTCGYTLEMDPNASMDSGLVQLVYGTTTMCTGNHVVGGTWFMDPSVPIVIPFFPQSTFFQLPINNGLCLNITTTSTTSWVAMQVSYVIQ